VIYIGVVTRRQGDGGYPLQIVSAAGIPADFGIPETVYVSSPAGSLAPGPSGDLAYAVYPIGKSQPYGTEPYPSIQGNVLLPHGAAIYFRQPSPTAPATSTI